MYTRYCRTLDTRKVFSVTRSGLHAPERKRGRRLGDRGSGPYGGSETRAANHRLLYSVFAPSILHPTVTGFAMGRTNGISFVLALTRCPGRSLHCIYVASAPAGDYPHHTFAPCHLRSLRYLSLPARQHRCNITKRQEASTCIKADINLVPRTCFPHSPLTIP